MTPTGVRVCDAVGFDDLLNDLARRIVATRRPVVPLAVVGVRTRGAPLAEWLAAKIDEPTQIGATDWIH